MIQICTAHVLFISIELMSLWLINCRLIRHERCPLTPLKISTTVAMAISQICYDVRAPTNKSVLFISRFTYCCNGAIWENCSMPTSFSLLHCCGLSEFDSAHGIPLDVCHSFSFGWFSVKCGFYRRSGRILFIVHWCCSNRISIVFACWPLRLHAYIYIMYYIEEF